MIDYYSWNNATKEASEDSKKKIWINKVIILLWKL